MCTFSTSVCCLGRADSMYFTIGRHSIFCGSYFMRDWTIQVIFSLHSLNMRVDHSGGPFITFAQHASGPFKWSFHYIRSTREWTIQVVLSLHSLNIRVDHSGGPFITFAQHASRPFRWSSHYMDHSGGPLVTFAQHASGPFRWSFHYIRSTREWTIQVVLSLYSLNTRVDHSGDPFITFAQHASGPFRWSFHYICSTRHAPVLATRVQQVQQDCKNIFLFYQPRSLPWRDQPSTQHNVKKAKRTHDSLTSSQITIITSQILCGNQRWESIWLS